MGFHGGAAVGRKGVMHLPWELLALGSWYGIVGKKVHSVSATHVIIVLTFKTLAIGLTLKPKINRSKTLGHSKPVS